MDTQVKNDEVKQEPAKTPEEVKKADDAEKTDASKMAGEQDAK